MASVTIAEVEKRFGEIEILHGVDIWAAAGSVDTALSFLSCLELYWADVPDGRVSTSRVAEAFDALEHV
jgi:hypothetical protein